MNRLLSTTHSTASTASAGGLVPSRRWARGLVALCATAVLAGASGLAVARGGHEGDGPPSAAKMERMQQRMAKHQAELKAKLKLEPSQEAAWAAFAAATQPPRFTRPDPAEMAKLTTPQRLDRMQAHKAERDAAMARRMDATRAFYAALTPQQQQVFDAETHHHGAHGGHGPHGGRGGHRGHGEG